MVIKKRVPKRILKTLDYREKIKEKPPEVMATIELTQTKLTIPSKIRMEMDFKKGQKFVVFYDKNKKELIYKLK